MIVVFILSALRWIRIRGLWKLSDGRDWLWGNLGLVVMGGARLNKSLIQFSVDGRGCVPFLLFGLRVGIKRTYASTVVFSAPTPWQATVDPRLCWRLLDTHRQVWVSLLWVTAPFSWVLVCTSFCLCPQESISPILCTFWQLYGGPTGGLMP